MSFARVMKNAKRKTSKASLGGADANADANPANATAAPNINFAVCRL
jgi:hypothetical protein